MPIWYAPWRDGYCPVIIDTRAGVQTGDGV
jgi:hypothetical protein